MTHSSFGDFFPDIAQKETRVITVIDQATTGLPPGEYGFIDLYCTDPECDCRNVYIQVVSKKHPSPLATICYGWESLAYYKKWMGISDDKILVEFKGPALAMSGIQSQYAGQLLSIFKQFIQTDKEYAARLQRHYRLVKNFIKNKNSPRT